MKFPRLNIPLVLAAGVSLVARNAPAPDNLSQLHPEIREEANYHQYSAFENFPENSTENLPKVRASDGQYDAMDSGYASISSEVSEMPGELELQFPTVYLNDDNRDGRTLGSRICSVFHALEKIKVNAAKLPEILKTMFPKLERQFDEITQEIETIEKKGSLITSSSAQEYWFAESLVLMMGLLSAMRDVGCADQLTVVNFDESGQDPPRTKLKEAVDAIDVIFEKLMVLSQESELSSEDLNTFRSQVSNFTKEYNKVSIAITPFIAQGTVLSSIIESQCVAIYAKFQQLVDLQELDPSYTRESYYHPKESKVPRTLLQSADFSQFTPASETDFKLSVLTSRLHTAFLRQYSDLESISMEDLGLWRDDVTMACDEVNNYLARIKLDQTKDSHEFNHQILEAELLVSDMAQAISRNTNAIILVLLNLCSDSNLPTEEDYSLFDDLYELLQRDVLTTKTKIQKISWRLRKIVSLQPELKLGIEHVIRQISSQRSLLNSVSFHLHEVKWKELPGAETVMELYEKARELLEIAENHYGV